MLSHGAEFFIAGQSTAALAVASIGCLGDRAQAALVFCYGRVIPVELGAPACDMWPKQASQSLLL